MELNDKELEEYNKMNASKETKKTTSDTVMENMNVIMIVLLSFIQVILSCLSKVDGDIQFVFPTTV